jgi:general stress protein 26
METSQLNRLIQEIRIAMLTTVENDGRLRSRPMFALDTHEPFDGNVWFFNSLSSPKTGEVQEDPRVTLSFADTRGQRYVSLTGTCELVRDPERARRYWRPEFQEWFPKGVEDPDLVLLRVRVEQAEWWTGDSFAPGLVSLNGPDFALKTPA